MKVLFLDTTHPFLIEGLREAGCEIIENYSCTENELNDVISKSDAIVIRSRFKLTKEMLQSATHLKFIARVGAGMENIDVDFAESIGIRCLHAPEGNMDAVAEHALGMLLALMNNIVRADKEVRAGIWKREANRGTELMGKTVGIIGYGNMGSSFAKRLSGFSVNVLAHDKYKTGFGNELVKESSLEDLFQHCDVLSIHLPLTSETKKMVDEQFISKFRKDIYLINTARGKIVSTSALANGIRSGKIKGACLDVLEDEALSFEKLVDVSDDLRFLFESDKMIFTPHIAGWSHESNRKLAEVLVSKILELKR